MKSLISITFVLLFAGCQRSPPVIFINSGNGLYFSSAYQFQRSEELGDKSYYLVNWSSYVNVREIRNDELDTIDLLGQEQLSKGTKVHDSYQIESLGTFSGAGRVIKSDNDPFGYAILFDFITNSEPTYRIFGQICMGSKDSTEKVFNEVLSQVEIR